MKRISTYIGGFIGSDAATTDPSYFREMRILPLASNDGYLRAGVKRIRANERAGTSRGVQNGEQ